MTRTNETAKQKMVKLAAKAARGMTEQQIWDGWPPVCVGLFHQPKRPGKRSEKETPAIRK